MKSAYFLSISFALNRLEGVVLFFFNQKYILHVTDVKKKNSDF